MMKERKYRIFSVVFRNWVEYFKKAKAWGLIEQFVAILRALSLTAAVIATQNLFDVITNLSVTNYSFNSIASKLLILGIILVTQQILSGTGQYLLSKVSYSNMGKLMVDFQKKMGRVPPIYFEDSKFLDSVNKAKECLEYESLGHSASKTLQLFSYYAVYLFTIGGYLLWLSPKLPLVILLAFAPSIVAQFAQVKVLAELEHQNAPLRRENEYYKRAIVDRAFFKETRMLGGFEYFNNLFTSTLQMITQKTWRIERKFSIVQISLSFLSYIGLGIAIFMLFNETMTGGIGVGAFVSVFIALSQVFSIMDEIVSVCFGEGISTIAQVSNFYRLMDIKEENGTNDIVPDFAYGVEADGISFSYPKSEKLVLNNISLTIRKGETIAIVGENGSGKSTLVRNLIGMYTPKEGIVTIGGLVSKNVHSHSLFSKTSGVFQSYQRYKMTLAENVFISDIEKPINTDRIIEVLQDSEFNDTSANFDTMLSPEFGGVDLSGGQWQRLAIARGLYRMHDYIVLDEPTASIDPIEESRLYNHFNEITNHKCAIIVTHRLGSVKLADRIIVMKDGVIEEIGSHQNLLSTKGLYAKLWETQKKWYVT